MTFLSKYANPASLITRLDMEGRYRELYTLQFKRGEQI